MKRMLTLSSLIALLISSSELVGIKVGISETNRFLSTSNLRYGSTIPHK
jgi:hypothetical protein